MTFPGLSEEFEDYIKINWRSVTYTSILYFFNFGAILHLIFDDDRPVNFRLIAPWAYKTWIALGVISPIIFVLSMFAMYMSSGRVRFFGVWMRLAANTGLFAGILAFWVAGWDLRQRTETYTYGGYLISSILCYVTMILLKDILTMRKIYVHARKIRKTRAALCQTQ